MGYAERFLKKRVHVVSLHPDRKFEIEGEVTHVFQADITPTFDDVLKYYFNGDTEKMMNSRHLKGIMRPYKIDRLVIEKDGKECGGFVIPYNELYFLIEEVYYD